MSQHLFKKVRRFVHEMTLKPIAEIRPESSLYFDLDIDLDKAPEFFGRFADAFEVDLQGIDFQAYFQPSPYTGNGIVAFLWVFAFFTRERHSFHGIKPLLVQDLVNAAKLKHWQA